VSVDLARDAEAGIRLVEAMLLQRGDRLVSCDRPRRDRDDGQSVLRPLAGVTLGAGAHEPRE